MLRPRPPSEVPSDCCCGCCCSLGAAALCDVRRGRMSPGGAGGLTTSPAPGPLPPTTALTEPGELEVARRGRVARGNVDCQYGVDECEW